MTLPFNQGPQRPTLLAAVLAFAMSCGAHAAVSVVVLEGGPAPSIPGAIIGSIPDPRASLNDSGQVAFAVQLAIGSGGVTLANDQVIYRHTFGAGSSIVARGQAEIPALPGFFYDLNSPQYAGPGSMNAAGEIAFFGAFGAGQRALFVNGTTVVRGVGLAAPGLPAGTTVSVLNTGAVTDARINRPASGPAEVLYSVQLAGTGVTAANNSALYRGHMPVAREGDAAPGTSSLFGSFLGVDNARINAAGHVAFAHDLAASASTTSANNGVVYRHTPGSGLMLLARDAAPAPGTGADFSAGGFRSLRINASGQVAYLGELAGGSNVLYIDTVPFARDGAAAPGLPGLTLLDVGGSATGAVLEFNDPGMPVFVAKLLGPGVSSANDSALYLGAQPIARTGSAAPIAGTRFDAFNGGDLALNNLNQVAIVALLAGSAVTTDNDRALFLWDGGGWQVVAREGDALAGSSIAELIGGDGSPRIELNDAGQVLFWANLADGNDGLFLTSPIPEPAVIWTLLAGLTLIGLRTKRGALRKRGRRELRGGPAP